MTSSKIKNSREWTSFLPNYASFSTTLNFLFATLGFFFDITLPSLASCYYVFYSKKTHCYDDKGTSHPHGGRPRASNIFESTYPKKENTSLSVNILLKIFQIVNPLSFWELMKKLNFFNVIIYGGFIQLKLKCILS